MKLIKPLEISARILTLLDESEERVILVSPYMKISKWYRLTNKIKELKCKGIPVEIYVRDDPDNTATYGDLDKLDLRYKKVPHLHSKLYLNERIGIVSSMNLLLSSELNSLEIGYATENWEEHNELYDYFQSYIHTGEPFLNKSFAGHPITDLKQIICDIRERHRQIALDSWAWFTKGALHFCTGRNNYKVSISNGHLRISSPIRNAYGKKQPKIQNSSQLAKKTSDLTKMKTEVIPGRMPGIIQLSGQSRQRLKSTCLTRILKNEADIVVRSVCIFIEVVDNLTL